ncbi:Uncharacterized protein Fot_25313 [Forsythia ovata]|uniref:Uncharacterized protein n=1 Tax=Forsythia ovata TaxID=205694 RepID=A0ABD1UA18_9LAMI
MNVKEIDRNYQIRDWAPCLREVDHRFCFDGCRNSKTTSAHKRDETGSMPSRRLKMESPHLTTTNTENGNGILGTKQEIPGPDIEDLAVMDYTPARKKTPIHN